MINMFLSAIWARLIEDYLRIQGLVAGLVDYDAPVFKDFEVRTFKHPVLSRTNKYKFRVSFYHCFDINTLTGKLSAFYPSFCLVEIFRSYCFLAPRTRPENTRRNILSLNPNSISSSTAASMRLLTFALIYKQFIASFAGYASIRGPGVPWVDQPFGEPGAGCATLPQACTAPLVV
jgi:hypothetical protein